LIVFQQEDTLFIKLGNFCLQQQETCCFYF